MSTRPFNVDIFDRKYNMVHHYTAGDAKHSEDYLSLVENSTLITFNENVQKGYYIRLSDGEREYFGIISGIHTGNVAKGYSEIKYKQFMSLFDTRILFDTDYQTSTGVYDLSLEETIAKYITDYFINNEDAEQNIPGLTVRTVSSTKPWGLNLTSQVKGLHKTIINFYNSILSRSLTKYGVGVNFVPDFNAKTITVEVGQKNTSVFRIEADLDSVIARNIVLNETSEDTNKLVVYDDRDLATKMVFFKHPDRTYDTVDDDRIVPVIYDVASVNTGDEELFEDNAWDLARRTFDQESYNNLIEITVMNEDPIVRPQDLAFGQVVNVVSEGVEYPSIFTGREVTTTTKLIFGTIRLELSKRLRGQRNG